MNKQRGDTIIEVFFATAIAGALILTALTIVNRNLATIQMSAETTLVRQNIDSQAEVLRFLKDRYMDNRTAPGGYPGLWRQIVSEAATPDGYVATEASVFGTCSPPDRAFFVAPAATTATDEQAASDVLNISLQPKSEGVYDYDQITSYAQIGRGIWVEAVAPAFTTETTRYVDFHIRACWDPPYSGQRATLGTIVRQFYTVGDDITDYGGAL